MYEFSDGSVWKDCWDYENDHIERFNEMATMRKSPLGCQ